MRIAGFIWIEEILDKLLRKHDVRGQEVVEVFDGDPKFRFVEKGRREGEHVYSAAGQTGAGRHIVVFFVYKKDHRAVPVSARDMTTAERKRYERK
jgi:uncharacterized DUF497 family protein